MATPRLDVLALEFSTRAISPVDKISRDAVIGDTGIAVWTDYVTNDAAAVINDLTRYENGKLISMGVDASSFYYGSAKPNIQGTQLVWIANYRNFQGDHYVMAEVPQRDDPQAPELSALYRYVGQSDDGPLFVNMAEVTNGMVVYTNNGVVVTNYIPEGEGVGTNQARRTPSGVTEVNYWPGAGDVKRITLDGRNDFAPSVWQGLIAWQKARGWPFGWEIMVWETNRTLQITTNYYYDMAPVVQGRQMAWYGWDGYDFEIYLYDADKNESVQITSNRYDDVGPVLWDGVLAWEGYPAVEADVFMWKNGAVTKLSDNVEDDFNPRIWNGQVVWQGFDGDDFEIYYYDGTKTVKLTANGWDDVNPDLRDNLIVWMGYEGNWDAEIYASDGKTEKRVTDNEDEDRDPKTAGGRIIWTEQTQGRSTVWLADPQ